MTFDLIKEIKTAQFTYWYGVAIALPLYILGLVCNFSITFCFIGYIIAIIGAKSYSNYLIRLVLFKYIQYRKYYAINIKATNIEEV